MLEFWSPSKTIRKKRKPRPRKTCAHSLLPSRSKLCTGWARRPGSPGDCLLCAPCSKWGQGKQTDQQVDAALHMRNCRKLRKMSAGGKDSQKKKESSNGAYLHNKIVDLQSKQFATPSKKSSPDLEDGPPTKKIVQKSKESVESGESDDDEKEEEVTQCPNNSQINSGTQYDTIIVSLLSLCVILCLTREKFAHSFRD